VKLVEIVTAINGRTVERSVPARMTLVEFLRNEIGLTGTKVSCELQVCGVCTVLVDGEPVSSCAYLAVDVDGRSVLTVEGVASRDNLHPVQQAFISHFAIQCGYCTPGFVMMTLALLEDNKNPTRSEVETFFDGNICRCTGYIPIIDAVLDAAERLISDRMH
jgi:aerobic-type carbon monoxide dehydrogenase small subunit (CoxS/CutS family)